jgi:hypothetical protein
MFYAWAFDRRECCGHGDRLAGGSGPCGFDRELALRNINEIRPGIRIFETSAKTGAGMEEWLGYLDEARKTKE